jgi:hypothetical protein
MNRTRIWLGAALLTAYALGLGVLGGIALERFRFDRDRAAVLREYEDKTARVRRWLMRLETDTARGDTLPAASLLEQEGGPRFRLQTPAQRPGEPKSYQWQGGTGDGQ